jgi:hypothetical protein
LVEEAGITEVDQQQTFIQKIMSSIGQKNSFLTYKVDRPRVLSNQDGKLFGYSKPESVFKKAV